MLALNSMAQMTTVKQLLENYDFDAVWAEIVKWHPEEELLNEDGYRRVLSELKVMAPENTDVAYVVIEKQDQRKEYKDSPEILATIGEDETERYWIDVSGLHLGDDTHWAIEFMPWAQWLNLVVKADKLELTGDQLLAHIVWEMTFFGFEQEDAVEKKAELDLAVRELDDVLDNLEEGEDKSKALKEAGYIEWKHGQPLEDVLNEDDDKED